MKTGAQNKRQVTKIKLFFSQNLLNMTKFNRLRDCVVTNKNVIIRVDINVPIVNGKIDDDTRIKAVIPTIKYLAQNQAKVIVISHFGRPEGEFIDSMSIKQLVGRTQELLGSIKVSFIDDCIGKKVEDAVENTNYGEVIMLENLRFYNQETKNDPEFSRQLASLGNLYVNDAFSCSHRSHASITGIPTILKSAAGFLMESELDNLTNLLENSQKPMMAVVGGAKVSTKLDLLNSLATKADAIVVGGGMANSFLYALGKNIGKSLCEKELKDTALNIIKTAKKNNCEIILPSDVVVVKEFKHGAAYEVVSVDEVKEDDIILDIGTNSISNLVKTLENFKTLVWNGPLGAFEIKPFNLGTENFAKEVARLTDGGKLLSIAGGGDVVSALNGCNLSDKLTYISTAGGAFLEWLEGKELPGVAALNNE
jgi:phosphoglycerate kinase